MVQIPKSASDICREVGADFGIATLGWCAWGSVERAMQRQLETFYGTILACAGFGVWALFSLLPILEGRGIREGWDTAPYWLLGIPLLLVLHGLVGALTDSPAWRLPLWAIGGHILAMVLVSKSGASLGLLPLAIIFVGLPMYVVLSLATLTGRMIARFVGPT
jgi:hypothetical protein